MVYLFGTIETSFDIALALRGFFYVQAFEGQSLEDSDVLVIGSTTFAMVGELPRGVHYKQVMVVGSPDSWMPFVGLGIGDFCSGLGVDEFVFRMQRLANTTRFYEFSWGSIRFMDGHCLLNGHQFILSNQAMGLFRILCLQPGAVVTMGDIRSKLRCAPWSRLPAVLVSQIRKSLFEHTGLPGSQIIKTVHSRGYRITN